MTKEQIARDLVGNVLMNLPNNRNSMYCELQLKNAACKLYLPLRNAQVQNAVKVKEFYQEVFDKAEY
jgi:hypothetical protein